MTFKRQDLTRAKHTRIHHTHKCISTHTPYRTHTHAYACTRMHTHAHACTYAQHGHSLCQHADTVGRIHRTTRTALQPQNRRQRVCVPATANLNEYRRIGSGRGLRGTTRAWHHARESVGCVGGKADASKRGRARVHHHPRAISTAQYRQAHAACYSLKKKDHNFFFFNFTWHVAAASAERLATGNTAHQARTLRRNAHRCAFLCNLLVYTSCHVGARKRHHPFTIDEATGAWLQTPPIYYR